MLKQSRQVIVVADSSKLGKVGPAFICPMSEVHMLITDVGASDQAIAGLLSRGIQVIRV
jgi:DeoR family transcriptional regulator of aga operon